MSKNTIKWALGSVIIAIIIVGTILILIPTEEESLRIGVILPLTGPAANFGEEISEGINLFAEQNPNLKILYEDDKFEPKESLKAYKKLKEVNNINYFIGPFGPVTTETIYSSMNQQEKGETLLLPPSLCMDQFKKYENILCTFPGLDKQVENSIKFIKSKDKKTVYIITENSLLGVLLETIFREEADKKDLEVIGIQKIDFTTTKDYNTFVTKVKQKNPDAVYFASSDPAANFLFMKKMKEQGMNSLIAANLDVSDEHLKNFKEVLEGVYFPGFIPSEYDIDFMKLFEEKHKRKPTLYNALGYELVYLAYEVIQDDRKLTLKQKVIDHQNKVDFAIIEFTYDSEAMVEIPLEVKQVKNGELVKILSQPNNF